MTKNEWKKEIFAITDPKLLTYIRDLCHARESVGRAEAELEKKPKKKGESNAVPTMEYDPHNGISEYPPMGLTTEDDEEEVI